MDNIYERLADDQRESLYFEPPYTDEWGGSTTPVIRTTPRPEGAPLTMGACPGCVDECHCTETGRILGRPQCAFCADLERTRPETRGNQT